MRKGLLPNGLEHDFYFPDTHPTMPGWFKGMEMIIQEQGLWPESGKLKAECKGFKCEAGSCTCCCQRLLFTQLDFCSHRSELEEYIKSYAISAIFTQNTIVSSILLSSIGV